MSCSPLAAPGPFLRLACASFWPRPAPPLAHLLGLRERLLQVVAARNVHLAVLHRSQWLLQWIEGPPAAVESAWQRIQRVPELDAHRLLHRSLGTARLREPLHIAVVFRRESPDQLGRGIAQLAAWASSVPDPACIWNELAGPGDIAPSGSIVVASAREHDGIDLLRRVTQRNGQDVVYRRFAGADPTQFDSGAAYADLPTPCGCTLRTHVLSRRCLRDDLVLGGLTDARELVLLVGTRANASRQVVEGALHLLHTRAPAARIHLLATEPEALLPVMGLLRDAGITVRVRARLVKAGVQEAEYLEGLLAQLTPA